MGNVIEIGTLGGRKLISSGDFIEIVLLTMFFKRTIVEKGEGCSGVEHELMMLVRFPENVL